MTKHGIAILTAMLTAAGAMAADSTEAVRDSLTFYAPFDGGPDATLAKGDSQVYWAPAMKELAKAQSGLPPSGTVRLANGAGRIGDALRFEKKVSHIVFFNAAENMAYREKDWEGTVSFWLKLSPVEQLETGFCDPVQITPRAWNDAAFFVEFEKRGESAPFRLGAYANYRVWNPTDRKWKDIPFAEKPLIEVTHPPFNKERWTHVAFSFSNFNTGKKDGVAKLYLDGAYQGEISPREQTFQWDPAQARIMFGLSYVGLFDELSIFNRELSADEVRRLHESPEILR